MPTLPIADKATLDQVLAYVDTLETLLGTMSPAAGDLTTVFRGLKLIADYVDTLETKLGINTDTAGTSTVFSRLAQIAGYIDTLETSLGQTGDAASATGSANAKLAAMLQRLGGGTRNLTTYWTGLGFPATSTTTMLSVSGTGILYGLYSLNASGFMIAGVYGTNYYSGLKITIDDLVYFDGPSIAATMGSGGGAAALLQETGFLLMPKKFNTSLLLQWINADTQLHIPNAGAIIEYITGVA